MQEEDWERYPINAFISKPAYLTLKLSSNNLTRKILLIVTYKTYKKIILHYQSVVKLHITVGFSVTSSGFQGKHS